MGFPLLAGLGRLLFALAGRAEAAQTEPEVGKGADVAKILESAAVQTELAALPVEIYQAGATVIAGGATTGKLFILREGAVEIVKDEVQICTVTERGRCSAKSPSSWINLAPNTGYETLLYDCMIGDAGCFSAPTTAR